jgi:hypothetical protein
VDDAAQKRPDVAVGGRLVEAKETARTGIAQARHELQPEQVEERENDVRVTVGVRRVLGDLELALVVENLVEHVRRLADRGDSSASSRTARTGPTSTSAP